MEYVAAREDGLRVLKSRHFRSEDPASAPPRGKRRIEESGSDSDSAENFSIPRPKRAQAQRPQVQMAIPVAAESRREVTIKTESPATACAAVRALDESYAEEEEFVPVSSVALTTEFVAPPHLCPCCAVGFNGSLEEDEAPYLFTVWQVFEKGKKTTPVGMLSLEVVAAYDEVVRGPLLKDGEECPVWSASQVENHLRDHIVDPEFQIINDARFCRIVKGRLEDACAEKSSKTGRLKMNHQVMQDWLSFTKAGTALLNTKEKSLK